MYKILIVDDEPWALSYMKKLFSRPDLGFEVLATETGVKHALRIVEELKPDVIITDIQMANLTGLDFLKMIREQNLQTLVVIATAYADFSYTQQAIRGQAFDYLVKPVSVTDAEILLERVYKRLSEDKKESSLSAALSDGSDFEFHKMLAYIQNHYSERLMIRDLAAHFCFSPNYCSSLFTRNLGMTFSQYITEIRMKKAAQLLEEDSRRVKEVALMAGYDDVAYFSKVFRKYYQVTPSEYVENLRRNGGKE